MPSLLNMIEFGVAGSTVENFVVPGRVNWLRIVAQFPEFGAEQPVVVTNTVCVTVVVEVRVEVPLIACRG